MTGWIRCRSQDCSRLYDASQIQIHRIPPLAVVLPTAVWVRSFWRIIVQGKDSSHVSIR